MNKYETFSKLLDNWQNLPVPGKLYIEVAKGFDIGSSSYWTVSSKEAKEQNMIGTEYGRVPEALVSLNVKPFLDSQVFQDIIEHDLEKAKSFNLSDTDRFADAIYYYLENDDFPD